MRFDCMKMRTKKKDRVMIYIIQDRFIRILYNEIDLGAQRASRWFPSMRNEQTYPVTVIKL